MDEKEKRNLWMTQGTSWEWRILERSDPIQSMERDGEASLGWHQERVASL